MPDILHVREIGQRGSVHGDPPNLRCQELRRGNQSRPALRAPTQVLFGSVQIPGTHHKKERGTESRQAEMPNLRVYL